MIVEYGEFKYIVQWKHYLPEKRMGVIGGKSSFDYDCPDKTYCEVIKMNEDGTLGTEKRLACATCSLLDQFNKNIGRKLSMKRAIQYFNKWQREKFWEAYAKMRNGNFGNAKRKV